MRKLQMLAIALVAFSFAASYFAYPLMPRLMASHWNIDGNADGYMPREISAYFIPLMGTAIFAILYILPLIDPKKENYKKFQAE